MAFQAVDRLPRWEWAMWWDLTIDKMTMNRGEQAMRAEFERLLPMMRAGGFIPSVDHQTPPGVSLDQYRSYLRLLDEYTAMTG